MFQPTATQIIPNEEPFLNWGVHFVHENVVSVYGPGDEAKAAAENTVKEWEDTDYPAKLVCQTVLPWTTTSTTHSRVLLTQAIREAASDPRGVLTLREWLTENGYESDSDRKTNLSQLVAVVKPMRKAPNIEVALNLLNLWIREHGYESLTSDEAIELLREKLGSN